MKTLVVLGLIAFAIYIALCAAMYCAQDRLLYFPTPEIDRAGVQDPLPSGMGEIQALIAAAPAGLTHVVVIPAAGHNDIETFLPYWPALKAFIDR